MLPCCTCTVATRSKLDASSTYCTSSHNQGKCWDCDGKIIICITGFVRPIYSLNYFPLNWTQHTDCLSAFAQTWNMWSWSVFAQCSAVNATHNRMHNTMRRATPVYILISTPLQCVYPSQRFIPYLDDSPRYRPHFNTGGKLGWCLRERWRIHKKSQPLQNQFSHSCFLLCNRGN